MVMDGDMLIQLLKTISSHNTTKLKQTNTFINQHTDVINNSLMQLEKMINTLDDNVVGIDDKICQELMTHGKDSGMFNLGFSATTALFLDVEHAMMKNRGVFYEFMTFFGIGELKPKNIKSVPEFDLVTKMYTNDLREYLQRKLENYEYILEHIDTIKPRNLSNLLSQYKLDIKDDYKASLLQHIDTIETYLFALHNLIEKKKVYTEMIDNTPAVINMIKQWAPAYYDKVDLDELPYATWIVTEYFIGGGK